MYNKSNSTPEFRLRNKGCGFIPLEQLIFLSGFISLIRNGDYLEHEEFNVVSAAPKKGLARV